MATKEQLIKDEVKEILNCQHDFYGENPPLREGSYDVAQESLFCKKCGNHFVRIIAVLSDKINKPLWTEIMENSNCYDMRPETKTIDLPKLYEILEKRDLVPNEKDGM